MTDASPPRRRRPYVSRKGLDLIVEGVATRVQPPVPPGLGEGLLVRARSPRSAVAMSASHEAADATSETRILIALARIEERQNSLVAANQSAQAAAEARQTNVMQPIATFVPRSEIKKDNRTLHKRIDGFEKRLDTSE